MAKFKMNMKKNFVLLFVLVLSAISSYAQMDTIFTNNEKIVCTIKEVTPDAVKFVYPGEDLINSVYKNTIEKIVFKSGRVQTFAEATSYKTVHGADDYDNVTLTAVESEIKGLYKLGDVSSKAKGTTTLSSMEKVKERAVYKLKIVAAMMGANIVYVSENVTTGNIQGTKYTSGKSTETVMAGIAYSNKLPNYDDFNSLLNGRTQFECTEIDELSQRGSDMDKRNCSKTVRINRVYNESGLIMMKADISGSDYETFRVIYFDQHQFTLVVKDGERIYNYKIKL